MWLTIIARCTCVRALFRNLGLVDREVERACDGCYTNDYLSGPATARSTSQTTGEKIPAPNTGKDPGASKHQKTGIDPSWTIDFPWLETTEDDSGELGMWCSHCRKSNCRPKRAPLGKAAWIEVPCKTITRQSLRDHLESSCHKRPYDQIVMIFHLNEHVQYGPERGIED